MGLFLFFIGILAFITCIVWLVVNLIRKKKLKKQGIGLVLGLILMIFGLTMPRSEEAVTVMLEEEKVNYSQLEEMIESKQANLLEIEEKIKDEKIKFKEEENKVTKKEAELKEVMELISSRDKIKLEIKNLNNELETKKAEITSEIETLNKELESKKGEAESLDSKIKVKKAELDSIGTTIKEKGEAPIELPAGQFIVGHDLSEGRYKAIPIGRGGNFKVYDKDFNLVVNTILTTRDHGVAEYVFLVGDKYVINATTPFKLIPIK